MNEALPISLILDGFVVVLLIATIIYAARLSFYLKRFKQSRAELEAIIRNLSVHIDKADIAVRKLNTTVDDSAQDLEKRMIRAEQMFDELDIVVQTGDSLASRLEELAVRNRKIIEGDDGDIADLANQNPSKAKSKKGSKNDMGVFSIRDPEMETGQGVTSNQGFSLDDDVLSDAERDLYNVIQNKKGES